MYNLKKQTSWEIKMNRVLVTLVTTKQLTSQVTRVVVKTLVLAIVIAIRVSAIKANVIVTPANVVNS